MPSLTSLELPVLADLFESTTSGVLRNKAGTSLMLGLCLTLPSQSHTSSNPDDSNALSCFESTSAGPRLARSDNLIARIRQLSGLTWEQLAQVCGTSRRTLHLWASGRRMHTSNEERLLRILGILQHIDGGSSDQNRRRLLEVRDDGSRIVDLIARGLLDEAAEAVDLMPDLPPTATEPAPRPLQAGRRPPSPVDLLDAMHDPVHREPAQPKKPRFRRLRRGK